jgi:DNA polymerase III subunit gamma/tau
MSYLVLARKYRPQTFDEVVCQDHVTQTLTNAIGMGRVPHAVLFSGPRGTGKTTVARVLAKAMNCIQGPTKNPCNICGSCVEITRGNAVDVFEIDGASNNSVEQIRELRENIKYMPAHSRYKIYIIDEVHMLSTAAFNALLKTLEEPPAHILFIFATTEPHKIPLTILSRCQRHDFKRVDAESISSHLTTLCRKEGFDVDEESLYTLSREAGGSMRDALSLLDQVMACSEGPLTHAQVMDILGVIDHRRLSDISNAVFQCDIPKTLEILDEIYDRGHDVKKLYSDIIAHFRNMIVVKMGKSVEKLVDLPKYEIDLIREQIGPVPATYLNQILDFLFQAEASIRYSDQPKLSLEMVFIKLLHIRPALPIDVLLEKIDHLRKALGGYPNRKPDAQIFSEIAQPIPPDHGSKEASASFSHAPPVSAEKEDPGSGGRSLFSGETDFQRIWEQLRNELKKDHPAVAASLAEAFLKNITNEIIEIEVSGSEFQINRIMRDKSLEALENICNKLFGKKMKVMIHSKKTENLFNEQNQTARTLKHDALRHPLVQEAMTIFKGEVLDVRLLQDPAKGF